MPQLNVCGEVRLVDGVLEFWDREKGLCGLFYVGPDGPTFEQIVGKGELILFSQNDPAKLRLAVRSDGPRPKIGGLSFNIVRPDGRCEELAMILGSVAEDADLTRGDLRGQLEEFIRPDTSVDMQQTRVTTTAYAEDLPVVELPSTDPRTGKRTIWTGLRNLVHGLWKFD